MEKQTGFGRHFGHHIGQKLGKKLGKQIGRKGEAIGQKFDQRVDKIAETVTTVAETAKQTAKTSLDQILLNLEHRGLNLKDSQDILQKVSQTVLDRAERIRSQITEHPSIGGYAPSWLKEPLTKSEPEARTQEPKPTAEAAGSLTEATVSEPAQGMQTPTLKDELEEAAEIAAAAGDEEAAADSAKPKRAKTAKSKSAKSTKSSK